MNKIFKKSLQNNQKAFGIDLGTTNSVISLLEFGSIQIIPGFDGAEITPSIISYTKNSKVLIGSQAKRQKIINSSNTFYSIKRFIGRSYKDSKKEISQISYKIVKGINDALKIYCPLKKKEFSPEELSSLVLKNLIKNADNFLKVKIRKAVITVPAYFNEKQRTATKIAGEIAGLDVLKILNEPTAAALAYGFNKKKNETIIVFDLGGGTFDISILEIGNDIFEVISTSGDTYLGGDDFDLLLSNYILKKLESKYALNILTKKESIQRVLDAAERAKIELSGKELANINLPLLNYKLNLTKNVEIIIGQERFEQIICQLLKKCILPMNIVLSDAKITNKNINKVILVGGSTRIPSIRRLISRLLLAPIQDEINPDQIVSLGASVQAGITIGEIKDLSLLDVTSLTLGVETLGGLMTPIILRNTSLPMSQLEIFSTCFDFQKNVEIHILQGENFFAKKNKSLGYFTIINIPSALKGIPEILISFSLDSENCLSILAVEKASSQKKIVEISSK